MLCVLIRSAKLALDCVFALLWPFSSNCLFFRGFFLFSWKYRHREMIFYIAIYKCVQRRKYINGFSQRGSMHELFFEDGGGWRGQYLSMHVSQIESNHIGSCWIYVLFAFAFFICLFVCFSDFFWFLQILVTVCYHRQFQKTLANAAC